MKPWSRNTLLGHMSNFDVSDEAGQLVFADWLEEQGQLGWAKLCRLFRESIRKYVHFVKVFPNWVRDDFSSDPRDLDAWKKELAKLENLQIS